MDAGSAYKDCELELIGEGYDPKWAAESCGKEEVGHPDGEPEKSSEDEDWEYGLE